MSDLELIFYDAWHDDHVLDRAVGLSIASFQGC